MSDIKRFNPGYIRGVVWAEKYPHHTGGTQVLIQFENGYGASVIQAPPKGTGFAGAYGSQESNTWELCVVHGDVQGGSLEYPATPVNSNGDILPWLSLEELKEALERIADLPSRSLEGSARKEVEG